MTGKGSATYAYDALDRLTQVISGTTTVQFAYNGDGVRLGKTVNGVATAYVQDIQGSLPVVLAERRAGRPAGTSTAMRSAGAHRSDRRPGATIMPMGWAARGR